MEEKFISEFLLTCLNSRRFPFLQWVDEGAGIFEYNLPRFHGLQHHSLLELFLKAWGILSKNENVPLESLKRIINNLFNEDEFECLSGRGMQRMRLRIINIDFYRTRINTPPWLAELLSLPADEANGYPEPVEQPDIGLPAPLHYGDGASSSVNPGVQNPQVARSDQFEVKGVLVHVPQENQLPVTRVHVYPPHINDTIRKIISGEAFFVLNQPSLNSSNLNNELSNSDSVVEPSPAQATASNQNVYEASFMDLPTTSGNYSHTATLASDDSFEIDCSTGSTSLIPPSPDQFCSSDQIVSSAVGESSTSNQACTLCGQSAASSVEVRNYVSSATSMENSDLNNHAENNQQELPVLQRNIDLPVQGPSSSLNEDFLQNPEVARTGAFEFRGWFSFLNPPLRVSYLFLPTSTQLTLWLPSLTWVLSFLEQRLLHLWRSSPPDPQNDV